MEKHVAGVFQKRTALIPVFAQLVPRTRKQDEVVAEVPLRRLRSHACPVPIATNPPAAGPAVPATDSRAPHDACFDALTHADTGRLGRLTHRIARTFHVFEARTVLPRFSVSYAEATDRLHRHDVERQGLVPLKGGGFVRAGAR